MSALAAVLLRDGSEVEPARLAGLSEALRPFGRTSAERSDGAAGLVRRSRGVSASPEDPPARQPVGIGGGRLLLFDGRLHHRGELAGALGLPAREADGLADGALFARAWARWDEAAPLRADGHFSFVVWEPARRVLTAGCSALRAPPLCFSVDRRRAIVATAPRAVFAWDGASPRIDDARLAGALVGVYGDPRLTYHRGVSSLCPGELLTVTVRTDRIRRYYDLGERVRAMRRTTAADALDGARSLLERAVADAVRGAEPPAVMLSGGLDSPAVAVTALEHLAATSGTPPLISFTGVPEPGWDGRVLRRMAGDERGPVTALARMYPALDARFVDAAGLGADHLLDRVVALAELPPRNVLNLPWIHECRRLALAAGRRTMLSGDSGNITLSWEGPPLRALLHARRPRAVLREIVRSPGRLVRAVGRRVAGRADLPRYPYGAIHPGYARQAGVDERAPERRDGPWPRGAASSTEARILALSNPLRDRDGRSIRMAMQVIHGVAIRSPLLDRRLVEWCLGLPDEEYLYRGRRRALVKRLMRGRLPPEVMRAPPGRQAADWHLKTSRILPRIREEIRQWRGDPAVACRLDLDRLLRAVDTWPVRTPLSYRDHPDYGIVACGLGRALAAGRFIRHVEHGDGVAP